MMVHLHGEAISFEDEESRARCHVSGLTIEERKVILRALHEWQPRTEAERDHRVTLTKHFVEDIGELYARAGR